MSILLRRACCRSDAQQHLGRALHALVGALGFFGVGFALVAEPAVAGFEVVEVVRGFDEPTVGECDFAVGVEADGGRVGFIAGESGEAGDGVEGVAFEFAEHLVAERAAGRDSAGPTQRRAIAGDRARVDLQQGSDLGRGEGLMREVVDAPPTVEGGERRSVELISVDRIDQLIRRERAE